MKNDENVVRREAFLEEEEFLGIAALRFSAGGYEAVLIPSVGANVVSLVHVPSQSHLLRSPESAEAFLKMPQTYGMPILFPPNRIAGGKFAIGKRSYVFPQNDTVIENCHIHGFLHTRPWKITHTAVDIAKNEVTILAIFQHTKEIDFYENFPHLFEFRMTLQLSAEGLTHTLHILNTGEEIMPLGVGFHTALRVPFQETTEEKELVLRASIGKRWPLENHLPAGIPLPLMAEEMRYRKEGVPVAGRKISEHYTVEPMVLHGETFRGVVLDDRKEKKAIVYRWSKEFQHMVLWNQGGTSGFMCAEPQTWAVNAPNLDFPDRITGLKRLQLQENWSAQTKLSISEAKGLDTEVSSPQASRKTRFSW